MDGLDMEMVLVPGGRYRVGSEEGEGYSDERPAFDVELPPFYIARYAVTVVQYRHFVRTAPYNHPEDGDEDFDPWGDDRLPAVNVSWEDARAFCEWAGLRLPTEVEWEVAARGRERREFPWEGDWDADRCRNSVEDRVDGPVAVNEYPDGESWCHCVQMAGNVWEWTASVMHRYPGPSHQYPEDPADDRDNPDAAPGLPRVLRGGSWADNLEYNFRTALRNVNPPVNRFRLFGLRCARTP